MNAIDLIGCRFCLGARGPGEIDCIHMVLTALAAMDIPSPPARAQWYTGDLRVIVRDIHGWGNPILCGQRDGDVLLHHAGEGLSFGVIAEAGLLHIDRVSQRVAWMPQQLFQGKWFRWKGMA